MGERVIFSVNGSGWNQWEKNTCFTKEDTHMTNKHMKIFSTVLVVKKMQITSIVANHCTAPKWPTLTELIIAPADKAVEWLELPDCAGSINRTTTLGKLKLGIHLPYDSAVPLLDMDLAEMSVCVCHKPGIKMVKVALFIIAKNWKQSRFPPVVEWTEMEWSEMKQYKQKGDSDSNVLFLYVWKFW